ncbi:MAG: thiamine pyrophosphate-dependent dehydrogenase E1 component subunit alpha [Anaerolineales bacterium]|nr:thiamine pyrophosphate-dependent dehydrogenase E1 component subunit alpha [Anaerolineales bacterium]MCS7248250.1 thiamine pyrophosphate-dependent dehydrogenase E1 component subunit alpha [Anaerolineales bacterium]MDW8162064.1 thiamine pyrophosphate-dependent dehydrogenase E1 component subunit alpha [Anaerolineales bacterium]MDW8446246.1 thiamine pyrophosphate-dependent dehydrogenase E1 component subunit alpha [Anaerolineales bacterium]
MVLPLPEETLLEMYWTMLLSRRLDERAWVLHRQGKIAFHISAIGHEAAQIGAAYAIRRGYDWVAPYYRDLTLMLALGYTPREFMLSLMGKKGDPCSGGRQMPNHWSLKRANVISHSSPVATQTSHAAGIGLAIKLRGEDKVVLTTVGEGSTSQGEWYEGVNWAAVHKLPVVFIIANNLYAISVRQEQQMAVANAADKALGLGLPGVSVDGMDFLAVYEVMKEAVERARNGGGPTVVEAKVYRITPHSSDDDDRSYRSREEVEQFKRRDPLLIARQKLERAGILTAQRVEELEQRAKETVEDAVRFGESAPYPSPEEAAFPVYAEDARYA